MRSELAKLEGDQANPTVATLNAVFRPFGWRVVLASGPGRDRDDASTEDAPDHEAYQELLMAVRAALERHTRRRR